MATSEMVGMKFNSWTVTGVVSNRLVECKCECGNLGQVSKYDLICNKSRRCMSCSNKFRGDRTHGMSRTHLYKVWKDMKARCYRKRHIGYANYGGRGINICAEWLNDFVAFYNWALANDYEDGLSIDRHDNDGDYTPDNCRWATRQMQNNNTRRNHYIYYQGQKYTLAQLSEKHGLSPTVVYKRLKRGWSIEEAINIKLNERRYAQ